jgi:Txe/YoeB family toxin of Txe-Axe toxin-antitoxin module
MNLVRYAIGYYDNNQFNHLFVNKRTYKNKAYANKLLRQIKGNPFFKHSKFSKLEVHEWMVSGCPTCGQQLKQS